MPTTFTQFKEEVIAHYKAKKNRHELDDFLVNPTPAKLRDYCLMRLSEGLVADDLEVFQKFFDPFKKEKSLEDAIYKYNPGSLKALQKFALNKTQDPEDRIVKLFAILVDYQPRPFRFSYDPPPIPAFDASSPGDDRETLIDKPNDLLESEDPHCSALIDESNGQKPADSSKDQSTMDRPPNGGHRLTNIYKSNKYALRFSGGTLLVLAILVTVYYLTPTECMCWNGERYLKEDCQAENTPSQVIGFNKNKFDNFFKIMRPDTLSEKHVGTVWYSKIDNKVEFFTGPGFHPTETKKGLKLATLYIIETYGGKNAERIDP
ncbi:hypothetical protein [Sphingobacterium thalpophilum]|uniref:hypothetical protein n=1 Tax=Sphingobacterium thalpophilum TaxID=259 RepID=UPI0024A76D01|nr:hypothetical protein [Sphingobacterium thalpophilum]